MDYFEKHFGIETDLLRFNYDYREAWELSGRPSEQILEHMSKAVFGNDADCPLEFTSFRPLWEFMRREIQENTIPREWLLNHTPHKEREILRACSVVIDAAINEENFPEKGVVEVMKVMFDEMKRDLGIY